MDSDLFFSSPRWRILEILAKKPSSPIEIAKEIDTSVSYVSQQLKLLEAASLIVKERTKAVDRGKPRLLYSLSNEILHLTALLKGSPAKKVIYLTDHHKSILRIWLLEDAASHYLIEKFYWKIEEDLKEVEGIYIDNSNDKAKIILVSESKKLKSKIDSYLRDVDKKIDCSLITISEFFKQASGDLHIIHDPKFIFLEKKLKGGKEKDGEKS